MQRNWSLIRRAIVVPVLALAPMLSFAPQSYSQQRSQEITLQFLNDVLLGQASAATSSKVEKWTGPIRLGMLRTSGNVERRTEQRLAVGIALQEVMQVLKMAGQPLFTTGIKIPSTPRIDETFNWAFVFGPRLEFYDVAKSFGVDLDSAGRIESLYYWRTPLKRVRIVSIFLIDDSLSGDELATSVTLAVFSALGIKGTSNRIRDSIFFADRGFMGAAKSPTELDRRALRFLYAHLEPGDDREDVRAAVDKYWHTLD